MKISVGSLKSHMWSTKKVSKCGGIIVNLLFCLSTKTLRTLNIFFSSLSIVFLLNWASTYRTSIVRFENVQKRVFRITAKPFRCTYSSNGILIFHDIYLTRTTKLVHVLLCKPYSSFKISFSCKFTLRNQIV